MRLNEVYTSALGDKTSQEFNNFQTKITEAVCRFLIIY